jgi:hypothetical protein
MVDRDRGRPRPARQQASHPTALPAPARYADVTSGGDTVVEPTPEPARYEETSAPTVTDMLTDTPRVPLNASLSRHARLSLLAACGPPTIGVT